MDGVRKVGMNRRMLAGVTLSVGCSQDGNATESPADTAQTMQLPAGSPSEQGAEMGTVDGPMPE